METKDYSNVLGYGSDPNLVTPKRPWPLTLSDHHKRLIGELADLFLPAQGDFPAPSSIGIMDFFDEWLSAPYAQQQSDRDLISSGLGLIDVESERAFAMGLLQLTLEQKCLLVDRMASDNVSGVLPDGRLFFKRFRYLLLGGYFTSDIGLQAIGYVGNVPMQEYPAVSSQVRQIIVGELEKLGLIASRSRESKDL